MPNPSVSSAPSVAETVDRFHAWLDVRDISQTKAARLVGVSPSTLSQVLSGAYAGDVARVLDLIQRAMARADRRAAAPQPPPFARTSAADEVLATLRMAHDEGLLVCVLGRSGVGKTIAAERYAQAEPQTIFISLAPAQRRGQGCSARPVLTMLARALDVEVRGGASTQALVDLLGDALRDTGRLVIVDEIDYAPEDVLQILRMIHDRAHCGLALIGTLSFLERLRSRNTSTLRQFLERVAYRTVIDGITDDDCDLILQAADLDKPSLATARRGAKGVARRLVLGWLAAQRLSAQDARPIDAQTVADAFATLMEA